MSRHDPLTPEERELARLLARGGGQPSPGLDAHILQAARDALHPAAAAAPAHAVDGKLRRTRVPRRRWPAGLGLAASVTLAVGVAWQLREPPPPREEAAQVAATAADTAAPAPPAMASLPAPPRVGDAGHAVVPADVAPALPTAHREDRQQPQPGAAPARATAGAVPAPAQAEAPFMPAPPHATVAPPPAAPATARMAVPAPPAPPAPPGSLPAPPAAQATMEAAPARSTPAPVASELERDRAESSAPASPADMRTMDALAAQKAVPAEPGSADQWLQQIREQRDRGDITGARASLARFVRTHPGHEIPEDLRPMLPPSP